MQVLTCYSSEQMTLEVDAIDWLAGQAYYRVSRVQLVKGREPGAMRRHVGCVHKHLNHGTDEKQTETTRAS